MEKIERQFKGIWIPAGIWLDKNLSILEKHIYAEICSLASYEKGCYASNRHFAEFCDCSERQVTRAITKLRQAGYIQTEEVEGKYRTITPTIDILSRHNVQAPTTKCLTSNTYSNTINNNNIGKRNTTDDSASLTFSSPFGDAAEEINKEDCPYEEIISLYHQILPTNPEFREMTAARRTKLRNLWKFKLTALENWRKYFEFIKRSDFLTGRSPSCKNVKTFNLEWFTTPSHFADIMEMKYHGGKK